MCISNLSAPVVRWQSIHHSVQLVTKTVGDSVIFNCRMSDPNVRVKLKQKAFSGVFVERFTDGCRVSRLGQTFVIHAVNFDDFGIYYCEAPQVKIRRKEEAYLKVNPGNVRIEFPFWRGGLCMMIQIAGVRSYETHAFDSIVRFRW